MLALAAAIAMAFGVQPPHASATQADGPHNSSHQGIASHSHFGASCLQAELDRPQAESNGAVAPGHADCSQVFTPLLRPVATAAPGYVVVAVTVPHELPLDRKSVVEGKYVSGRGDLGGRTMIKKKKDNMHRL